MASLIPFEDLSFDPEFSNTRKSLNNIEELAANILQQGLINPITVRVVALKAGKGKKETDGSKTWKKHYIIAGFRRYEALKLIRKKDKTAFEKVPVTKSTGSLSDALYLNLSENIEHDNLSPMEVSGGVKRLLDMGNSTADIAERLGVSLGWVQKMVVFETKAADTLKAAVEKKKITFSEAIQIAKKHSDEKDQTDAAKQVATAREASQGVSRAERPEALEKRRKALAQATGKPHKAGAASIKKMVKWIEEEKEHVSEIVTILKWVLGLTSERSCKMAITKLDSLLSSETEEGTEETEEVEDGDTSEDVINISDLELEDDDEDLDIEEDFVDE